ncbi:MAG TPA: hypothetical protein V6D17_11405 [Candidatus Obscuribacterales bacterium]
MATTTKCSTCSTAAACCRSIRYIVTPALTVGFETDFDPDHTDLFVLLDARQGFAPLTDAMKHLPIVDFPDENPEFQVAAHVRLCIAGFPKMPPARRKDRVACGIFAIALAKAIALKCERITVVLSHNQFGGDMQSLASVLHCRVKRTLAQQKEPVALKEIEFLCRLEDKEAITEGLADVPRRCVQCLGVEE